MSKYWQINPDPGASKCFRLASWMWKLSADLTVCQPTNSKLYVLSVLIPDVLTDVYLLSIPLPVCLTHPA
jgi:hypothetical protein